MLVPAGNVMWQRGMPASAYRDVLDRRLTHSTERHISTLDNRREEQGVSRG